MKMDIDTCSAISALDAQTWNHLVGDESPFLEYGFLASLESTGCVGPRTGWTPNILTARKDGRLVGAVPLYLKTNSAGEFVFDWSWADAAFRAGIDYYPKAVVAVPFTPVTGARILVRPDITEKREIASQLLDATLDLADELELSSVHFNFLRPDRCSLFEQKGLPIRLGMQYHWINADGKAGESPRPYGSFQSFLARFRSKKRSNIRRERRKLCERGVTTAVLTGSEIDESHLRRIFRYYSDTVQKHFYGRQYLNEDFFLHLGDALSDRLHLVFAELDGQPYAGAFNLMKGARLYGRYWGCERDIPYTHFEVCMYRPIQWCIDENILAFEPGAGGEHKFDRGFRPTPTYSAHYIRDPGLRRAISRFLEHERSEIEGQIRTLEDRSPFKY